MPKKKPAGKTNPPLKGLQVRAGDQPTIYIYDEIGPQWAGMIDAPDILAGFEQLGDVDEFDLRINSPGGLIDVGSTIFNLLVDHPAKIHVKVDGLAASIASVIAMAGDTITVASNSLFMIHNGWTIAIGNKHDMRAAGEVLEKADGAIIGTYAERTENTTEQLTEWMDAETWFTADEAVEHGFADAKSEGAAKNITLAVPKGRYKNAPQNIGTYERELPGIMLRKPPHKPSDEIPGGPRSYRPQIAARIAAMRTRRRYA